MAPQASRAVRPVYHITGQRDGKVIVSMSLGHTGQVTPIEITGQDGDLGYFNYVRFRVLQGERPEVRIDRDQGHLVVPDDYKALMKDNPVYMIITDVSYMDFFRNLSLAPRLRDETKRINPFFDHSFAVCDGYDFDAHYTSKDEQRVIRVELPIYNEQAQGQATVDPQRAAIVIDNIVTGFHHHHNSLFKQGRLHFYTADKSRFITNYSVMSLLGKSIDSAVLLEGVRMWVFGLGPVPPGTKASEDPLKSLERFRPAQEVLAKEHGYTFKEHCIPLAERL